MSATQGGYQLAPKCSCHRPAMGHRFGGLERRSSPKCLACSISYTQHQLTPTICLRQQEPVQAWLTKASSRQKQEIRTACFRTQQQELLELLGI